MPFLQRGSAQIFYETYPAQTGAAWVTLINGHARGSTDFRAFGKYLSERGKSVLTLDNRGSGQTTSPSFTFAQMLQDVVALWDEHQIAATHLLGISYGGVLSQNLAVLHPKRVRSLILTSTTYSSQYLDSGRRLAELPLSEREKELGRYFGSAYAQYNPIVFKSLVKKMAEGFDDPFFLQKAREQRAALNQFDFKDQLSQIRCPCLILHGTDDRVIDMQSAHQMHAGIAGSVLELFDGVGHLFLAESPKRFYETALQFFEANDL